MKSVKRTTEKNIDLAATIPAVSSTFTKPIARDHDVVRLEIAMHDAHRMSFRQSYGDVLQVPQQLAQFGSLAVDLLAESNAFHKLHGDEVSAVALTNLVNVCDVWMIERRCGFRLLHKATHAILVCSDVGWQNLQHDFAIELCVVRQTHLAHSTHADLRNDAVMRQNCAGRQILSHLQRLN
jgi:hypothetical protein